MNGTVLDILLYVFDRYMIDEAPDVPEREILAQDLTSAGFGEANVERALDWLADLAGERGRAQLSGLVEYQGTTAMTALVQCQVTTTSRAHDHERAAIFPAMDSHRPRSRQTRD